MYIIVFIPGIWADPAKEFVPLTQKALDDFDADFDSDFDAPSINYFLNTLANSFDKTPKKKKEKKKRKPALPKDEKPFLPELKQPRGKSGPLQKALFDFIDAEDKKS